MPELGQTSRRLINLVYSKAPLEARDSLALEQFLDALPNSDRRIRIKQEVSHADKFEAYLRAED